MTDTTQILDDTITELESREEQLKEQVEQITNEIKPELKQIRKALGTLRRTAGAAAASNGGEKTPPQEATTEAKDAVVGYLGGVQGARPQQIADGQDLPRNQVDDALRELEESGDIEKYGRGLYRLAGEE